MSEPPLEELYDYISQITDKKTLRSIQCLAQMQIAISDKLNDGEFVDTGFPKP